MKQMRITYIILMAMAALLMAACNSHDDEGVPVQTVTMPIRLSIPAEGFSEHTRATAAGDPGTFETFKLPQFLYAFLYSEYIDGTNTTRTVIFKKIDLTAGSTNNDDKQTYVSKFWKKVKADNGDSLYTYKGDLSIDLPLQRTNGRVYVAASYFDLLKPDKPNLSTTDSKAVTKLTSEEDIKNVCFTVKDEDLRNSLQDLYSSPYNYKINNEYYGTLKDYSSKVPHIDMVLYHVAARVDISWNVAADTEAETLELQKQLRITFQEPRKNFQTQCLLFRPMENVVQAADPWPSPAYDLNKLITMNQGNHWYGRQVYYMIPYKFKNSSSSYDNQLIVNWRMVVNEEYNTDNNNATYGKNITIGVPWPDGNVFVPSIRGVIRVKSNFTVNTTSSTD